QRAREFGIRHALGADGGSIRGLVLKEGLRTAGAGVVVGLAGAFATTPAPQAPRFRVPAPGPAGVSRVAPALLRVAAAASYVPARRATRVDPMMVLRDS